MRKREGVLKLIVFRERNLYWDSSEHSYLLTGFFPV